jgi:glycosyltransferase involved in cell wall biosynthesis
MQLSIICPTFNEINYIEKVYLSLIADDGIEKEILFADGGSTDGTREKIKEFASKNANVHLINNPNKTATHGFNTAFKYAKGKYIAFIGAHAEYDVNYFKYALKYLEANECDAVGGPLIQKGKGIVGEAIACVMSSKFGVGNTEFRTMKEKMYVDSVAFAVYKREVFDNAGLLDTSLKVNQDDEFHYRINKLGYRILMVPEMKATYYVRGNLKSLFKQYFNYGLYKPLVFKKVNGSIRIRHIIPSLFCLYLILLTLAYYFPIILVPLFLYFVIIVLISFSFKINFKSKLLAILVFPTLHISYGLGFILGLLKIKKLG